MNSTALIAFSMILMLTGCASTTPIAVATPQWHVPPVDQQIKQQEMAALSGMTTALDDWSKTLSNLPTQPAPEKPLF